MLARLAQQFSLGRDDLARAREMLRTVRNSGRHLCTLPRSGTGLVTTMVTTAFDIERGGSGEYDYIEGVLLGGDGAWVHRDIRLRYSAGGANKFVHELVTWKEMPILKELFLSSHYPILPVLFRPTDRGSRTVIVVRDLMDQLNSWARHQDIYDDEEFIASTYPAKAIEFCNSWGERFTKPERGWRGLVVRYEDLVRSPVEQLQRICDFGL